MLLLHYLSFSWKSILNEAEINHTMQIASSKGCTKTTSMASKLLWFRVLSDVYALISDIPGKYIQCIHVGSTFDQDILVCNRKYTWVTYSKVVFYPVH